MTSAIIGFFMVIVGSGLIVVGLSREEKRPILKIQGQADMRQLSVKPYGHTK